MPPAKTPAEGWPLDSKGNPMVLISMSAVETVPTGSYANVKVGPATVSRFVEDGKPADIKAEIEQLGEIVEGVVAEDRERVLKSIQGQAD